MRKWIATARGKVILGHSSLLLRRVFRINRQVLTGARPVRPRGPKNSRLRTERQFAVERSSRDDDEIRFLHVPRQATASRATKTIGEALRLGDFEIANQLFAPDPFDRPRLHQHVRGMPRPRRLAATLAVAMIKLRRLAADFILHGTAETTTAEDGLSHWGRWIGIKSVVIILFAPVVQCQPTVKHPSWV